MFGFFKYLHDLSAPMIKTVSIKTALKCNLRRCRGTLLPNPKTKKTWH